MKYFTGHTINDKQRPNKEFSRRTIIDKTALRYSAALHTNDWTKIINQILPSFNHQRTSTLLHISGQFSVNPLLMLGRLIQEQKSISHTMKSDEEFRISLKSFANALSRFDQEWKMKHIKSETSTLEYSLRKVFNNDERLMNDFLDICDSISNRYHISVTTGQSNSISHPHIFKRNEETDIKLKLPFSSQQCWQLGASHFGAQETEVSIDKGTMSAIDMAPSLFQVYN